MNNKRIVAKLTFWDGIKNLCGVGIDMSVADVKFLLSSLGFTEETQDKIFNTIVHELQSESEESDA
jgi:hypothetical protein